MKINHSFGVTCRETLQQHIRMKTFLTLLCVFAVSVTVNGLDCYAYLQRTDVSRIEKIFKCLGSSIKGPKTVANQVCTLSRDAPAILNVKPTSLDSRPIENDLSYLFQIEGRDRMLSGGDVIGSFQNLTLEECSHKCTGNNLCLSFSYATSDMCILSSTCNSASTADPGTAIYNVAYWYVA